MFVQHISIHFYMKTIIHEDFSRIKTDVSLGLTFLGDWKVSRTINLSILLVFKNDGPLFQPAINNSIEIAMQS